MSSQKLDKTDVIFSRYIREKAKWRCEYCRALCKRDAEILRPLDAAHYFSRNHENVRFDEENVHAFCRPCHQKIGGRTRNENGLYDLWIKELLGEVGFYRLVLRANEIKKTSHRAEEYIRIKENLNRLKEGI